MIKRIKKNKFQVDVNLTTVAQREEITRWCKDTFGNNKGEPKRWRIGWIDRGDQWAGPKRIYSLYFTTEADATWFSLRWVDNKDLFDVIREQGFY